METTVIIPEEENKLTRIFKFIARLVCVILRYIDGKFHQTSY